MQLLAKVQVIDGALSCENTTCKNGATHIVENEHMIDDSDYPYTFQESYCEEHYQSLVTQAAIKAEEKRLDDERWAAELAKRKQVEEDYQARLLVGKVSKEEQREHGMSFSQRLSRAEDKMFLGIRDAKPLGIFTMQPD